MRRWIGGLPLLAAVLLSIGLPVRRTAAQSPNLPWRTITTRHFRITFNPQLEPLARRLAGDAERAYGQLSNEMHPPRGTIDVVLSDDVDFSNGFATPFPTNRIVVYANPPVSETALRYTNDWIQLVITHELTHIFHLDRVRGVWALSQRIFGRAPTTFPGLSEPSWLVEGLAVYEESRLAGDGRVQGSEHRMIARAASLDRDFPSIGQLSLAQGRFPFGESAYGYGSLFVDYLAHTRGEGEIRNFVEKESADLIPYLPDIPAKQAFGVSFSSAWKEFRDSIARTIREPGARPLEAWRQLTRDGPYAFSPEWTSDTTLVYSGGPGRDPFGAYGIDTAGKRTRIGRRNNRSPNVRLPSGALLYSQIEFTNPYQERSDLFVQTGSRERQLTHGARIMSPDARAGDGAIVAAQITPGGTRLVRVSRDGKQIAALTTGGYDEQWTEPRWSRSGDRIAAARWLRGDVSQIVVIDTLGRILHIVSSGNSIEATPSWLPGDAGILYSSDRGGTTQLYLERFDDPRTFAGATTRRLSDVATGVFEPESAPHGGRVAASEFRADGYHVGIGDCCTAEQGTPVPQYLDTVPHAGVAPVVVDSGRVGRYNPWHTFLPRYWLPTADQGIDGGYRVGLMTSGSDVVGRHSISATLEFPTNNTGVVGNLSYQYAGLGVPVLEVDLSQDWESLGGVFSRSPGRPLIGELFRRTRDADLLATWLRQRVRSALALTAGVAAESRSHSTTAPVSIASLDSAGELGNPTFPTLIGAASYATYERPAFSISPENGFQFATTVRDRLKSGPGGQGAASLSTVATLSLYKAIDLPGFAHHVIALRGAAGIADTRAAGYYGVGGISGGTFQIVPGYVLGEGRTTFPVRGFPANTLIGTRAFTGSAEYRLPLALIGNAPGILPFFLDRSSLTLFSDVGSAWCPDVRAGREVCNTPDPLITRHIEMASAGAELNVNLGVLSWDSPYRFRLGAAAPTYNGRVLGAKSFQVYVVAGVNF